MTDKVRLKIELPYRQEEREEWIVSKCGLLPVEAVGKTVKTSVKNLEDSIALWLERQIELETLAKELSELGWTRLKIGDRVHWVCAENKPGYDLKLFFRPKLNVRHKLEMDRTSHQEKLSSDLPWHIQTYPELWQDSGSSQMHLS